MKVLSANAVHKTELGGVRLNVAGPQVEATFDELASVATLDGTSNAVLVQQQAKRGIELLASVSFNTGFGAVMTVAAGGTASELADDSAHGLLPLTESRALKLLESLRCYPLLNGYRGGDPADRVALVETLMRLSDMALSLREWLFEIEINPIIASPAGSIAVDAVIKLRKP
jgi:succinyl-CoA synthetase beta subunit